jgi:urease accessory protein
MSAPRMHIRTPIITADPPAAPEQLAHGASQLRRLLHLASPALPIGAFHFSQGLEYAVEAGWVRDEPGALEWIGGIADGSLATLDLPVLARLHAAWRCDDLAGVRRWNSFLIASRETAELRAEDRHLGDALLRVLAELDLAAEVSRLGARQWSSGIAHATSFAFACARWDIASDAMSQAFAWAWVENQVLAAVKLVPLGQSAGQRMLHALGTRLGALVLRSIDVMDSDIGISTAVSALASGRHEIQYTRLFRS